jgi:RNA polymerase sigma factor (sigma-70 family)
MDRTEKERLLLDLLPLIRHVAGKFSRHDVGFERDDVQQEACIAAYKALDEYDPALGIKLSTWVWNGIVFHLKSRWATAHHPKRWTEDRPWSLSFKAGGDEDNKLLADTIPDHRSSPFQEQFEFQEAIRPCFCHERSLLIQHFYQGYTFQEIGEQQHLSGERIRQKTAAAIERLRRWEMRK